MHIQAVTIFPEMFSALTESGVTGRSLRAGLWRFDTLNPRNFADNPLGYVDDRPFGGGPGMIMAAPPLQAALDAAKAVCPDARMVYMSPQGKPATHDSVVHLARQPGLIILCGRYEGVDERILQHNDMVEICIGDIVVSGGELPAMMLADAVLRLQPGVLGDERSAQEDSFAGGLLDCPHYTRPAVFENIAVPDVLRGGNHAEIARWRLLQSLRRTQARRPDLLAGRVLTPEESGLLRQYGQEERDIP